MRPQRILADMNLSPRTVAWLRDEGVDAIRVSEILPPDTPDADILAAAARESRILVTQDNDFGMLLATRGLSAPSVITLRLAEPKPESVAQAVLRVLGVLGEALDSGAAIVVTDDGIRWRPLPFA